MIQVHQNCDRKGFYWDDAPVLKENLTRIATVATTNLDTAYALTQNISGSWTLNPEVTLTEPGTEYPSVSMGDVLELDGEFYIVDKWGFTKTDFNNAVQSI